MKHGGGEGGGGRKSRRRCGSEEWVGCGTSGRGGGERAQPSGVLKKPIIE